MRDEKANIVDITIKFAHDLGYAEGFIKELVKVLS